MTYQEFKETVIHAIQTTLGTDVRITIQDIIKNNDTHLDGLTILSEQSNISPTIYLNPCYEQYVNGREIPDICKDILNTYHKHAPVSKIDISFFTDYEKVKEHVIFKLVNYERNIELLKKVPHIRYLDLAIVFNCMLSLPGDGFATILIHNQHLSYWNITTKELYELAKKNTPILLSHHLQSMTTVLKDTLSLEEFSALLMEDDLSIPMYILTNHQKLQGSACILYENLLAKVAAHLESDLYILPSSVHEVLLLPASAVTTLANLTALVKEVNATNVSREEFLSDHVYYYSRETGNLSM